MNIALSGFPEPILQQTFRLDDGTKAEADFYWQKFNAIGECDGTGKHFNPAMIADKTTAEVVYAKEAA